MCATVLLSQPTDGSFREIQLCTKKIEYSKLVIRNRQCISEMENEKQK